MDFLAQSAPPVDWIGLLVQGGVAGVVLAWFMFRTENRLKLIENAVDRMARAHLLSLLANPNVPPGAKEIGLGLIKEIDDVKMRDGK